MESSDIKEIIKSAMRDKMLKRELSIYYTESKPELEYEFSDCRFSFFNGVLTIVATHTLTEEEKENPENFCGITIYSETDEQGVPTERWKYLRDNTEVIIMLGNITDINPAFFNYFARLHTVVFTEALQSIGYCNFIGCPNLKYLHLPKHVKDVRGLCDINSILYIDVAEENKHFASVKGYLLSKDKKTLIAVPGGLDVVDIPACCEIIGYEALTNSHTKICIPSTISEIDTCNFYSHNLKEIVLGDYKKQYPLIEQCFTRNDSLEYKKKFDRLTII